MTPYTPRYPGPRWSLIYGSRTGVSGFALNELQRAVQARLPYVLPVLPAQETAWEALQEHAILLGTPKDNPLVARCLNESGLSLGVPGTHVGVPGTHVGVPGTPDGYPASCLAQVLPAPWNPERHIVLLTGSAPEGVLHAVEVFNSRILCGTALPDKLEPGRLRQALDAIADCTIQEAPAVPERGLWTWGYVIYDYVRFLDNLARLHLNRLTIWNDVPPVNCHDVIAAAHQRGVQLCLGFPWGWGMDYDLADPADRRKIQDQVIEHYARHIQPQQPDGIYFQTLTEHNQLELGGKSVAALTCELVNRTASALYELTPGLDIRFGVHATSIRQNYREFIHLDPRITIVWEDAGALPFSYLPTLELNGMSYEETLEYACELASFRPGTIFAMIAKGWTTLDWEHEFEHHGPYLLGQCSRAYTRKRLELIQPRWDKVNTLWLQHFQKAQSFYQALLKVSDGKLSVLGLVEDGLFEESIQPSVALFAETLWDPYASPEQLLQRALNRGDPTGL
jgi:hypothetical protein